MNHTRRTLWTTTLTALTIAAFTALGAAQAPDTATASDDPAAAARQAAPTISSSTGQQHPIIRNGSHGQAVIELQQLLTTRGHSLTPDGAFGPRTEAAVKAFQTQRNLQADGIVGPRTWNALTTPSSTKPTVPSTKPASNTYTLKFTKNWKQPRYSRLELLRNGKTIASYRAGSGKNGVTDECASGQGWLPNGTYRIEGHQTNRGADTSWFRKTPAVAGYAIELADKDCKPKPQHGQEAVNRTDLFIHSEMAPDGNPGPDIENKTDDPQRWNGGFDYNSSGCIKLTPAHVKDLFTHLARAGWPKNLTLQVVG